jgi:hypothetical protein
MVGSFEELKTLMNELTEKDLKRTSPGGHCKLLELDEAEIRWYSNNKSLTIRGKASDDIKSQLRILADLSLVSFAACSRVRCFLHRTREQAAKETNLSRADTEVTDEGNNNGKDAP